MEPHNQRLTLIGEDGNSYRVREYEQAPQSESTQPKNRERYWETDDGQETERTGTLDFRIKVDGKWIAARFGHTDRSTP